MRDKKKVSLVRNVIHQSIGGLAYPASKKELIQYARAKTVDKEAIDLLGKLPPLDYRNEPHVLSTLREYISS